MTETQNEEKSKEKSKTLTLTKKLELKKPGEGDQLDKVLAMVAQRLLQLR